MYSDSLFYFFYLIVVFLHQFNLIHFTPIRVLSFFAIPICSDGVRKKDVIGNVILKLKISETERKSLIKRSQMKSY